MTEELVVRKAFLAEEVVEHPSKRACLDSPPREILYPPPLCNTSHKLSHFINGIFTSYRAYPFLFDMIIIEGRGDCIKGAPSTINPLLYAEIHHSRYTSNLIPNLNVGLKKY